MRINELLTELTFQGSQCTKDCSGHMAGYQWGQANPTRVAASNASFNSGSQIAADKLKTGNKVRPKIRTQKGTFAPNPAPRKIVPRV